MLSTAPSHHAQRAPLMRLLSVVSLLSLLSLHACQNTGQNTAQPEEPHARLRGTQDVSTSQSSSEASAPELIEVRADRQDLLFLYQDAEGQEQRAISVEEIPTSQRARVQVIDLSRSPAERKARDYVQLFDLSAPRADGSYRGRLVRREALEEELKSAQALPEQPPIVIYTTSWCGVCKKAKRFMEKQGWAFIEKDIETDKEGARELQQKAARAQLQLGGVPVIDVGGRLMSGFDERALTQLVKGP